MGVYDSVAAKATRKNKQPRVLRVFVCSPLRARGDHTFEDNVELAKRLCKAVADVGHAPYAPRLFFQQFLNDSIDRERKMGTKSGLVWLAMADEVWVYSESLDDCSDGMLGEVTTAGQLSIPPTVRWMPEAFVSVKWPVSLRGAQLPPVPDVSDVVAE